MTYNEKSLAVTNILRSIAARLKELKDSGASSNEVKVEVFSVGHGLRPFGCNPCKGDYVDYEIRVNGKSVVKDIKTRYDVHDIADHIYACLPDLRKKFGNLVVESKPISLDYNFSGFDFPYKFMLLSEPCKEFLAVQRLIKKFTDKDLTITDLYTVNVAYDGGQYRGEQGKRKYLAYDKEYCNSVLNFLRKTKRCDDKLVFSFDEGNDVSSSDISYSARNLEWVYGTGYRKLKLTARTPMGKLKYFE